MKIRSLAIILVVALVAGTSSAATINVSTWADALAATPSSGDTVLFAPGTYTVTATLSMKDGVTYKGAGSGDNPSVDTILDGGGVERVFHAYCSTNVVETHVFSFHIEDLRVINALATDDPVVGGPGGGAIKCEIYYDSTGGTSKNTWEKQTATITNVVFKDCVAPNKGGAIRFPYGSLTITDCEFINCDSQTSDGGAVCVDHDGESWEDPGSVLTITGCTFTDCDANGDDGGAVQFDSEWGTLTITDCTFINNTCSNDGGAVQNYDTPVHVTIDGCLFDSNQSGADGGHLGLHNNGENAGAGGTTFMVRNSIFKNGVAIDEEGAINASENHPDVNTIENCLFINNASVGDGCVSMRGNTISFINNTVVGNRNTGSKGAGVLCIKDDLSPSPVISNNIFLNNDNTGAGDVVFLEPAITSGTITNNCFFGNIVDTGSALVTPGVTDTGRITDDPKLDPTTYKPTLDSTAIIDAADPAQAPTDDLEGTTRDANPDVGAYELAVADTDGDGMPDDWEDANGLDKNVDDAALDADGDGITNLEEYNNGTDPQVKNLEITEGAPVAGIVGLGLVAAACALGGAISIRKKN